MLAILFDHNVGGHFAVLASIWVSPEWIDYWRPLNCEVHTFESLGLAVDLPDSEVWSLCQRQGIVLITGNRNADGEDSLEMTMRRLGTNESLPVLTIADPNRVIYERPYAVQVAIKVLDFLIDVDRFRGTPRVYVP